MIRKLSFITLSVFFLMSFNSVVAWSTESPIIEINALPKIGEVGPVGGYITLEGQGNYSDYRISMALEVSRGGPILAPKPTITQPSVEIDAKGRFSCRFISDSNDAIAERLYVYLIPRLFTPNKDAAATQKAALCTVIITRHEKYVPVVSVIRRTPPR